MTYLLLLPIMIWPACGWATPFFALIAAFLLLGVENIGVQIEEPFSVRGGRRIAHLFCRELLT